jgi:hypothetical protein
VWVRDLTQDGDVEHQPGPAAPTDRERGLQDSDHARKGGRVSRPAGLHPAEPPAKHKYHRVARPPRDSRGTCSSQSGSESLPRSSPCSGGGSWSPEQLQLLAATTTLDARKGGCPGLPGSTQRSHPRSACTTKWLTLPRAVGEFAPP